MIDDIGDDFIPGVLNDPLKGFEELRDILDPVTGRLVGRFGVLGLTIEEAARSAEVWWNETGRRQMPDYGKPAEYLNKYGMKSGVLLGLPWAELNRGERVRVVKVWHNEIGIFKHGMGITTEKDLKNVLEEKARERIRAFDLGRVFGTDLTTARH